MENEQKNLAVMRLRFHGENAFVPNSLMGAQKAAAEKKVEHIACSSRFRVAFDCLSLVVFYSDAANQQ